jgi:hypothetical protein
MYHGGTPLKELKMTNFDSIISQIADEINNWEINSSLPSKAAALLAETQPWKYFSTESFSRDFLKHTTGPSQFSFGDGFGQPAITLWSNEKLRIELYFWNSSSTSVHSHAFAGAFTVVDGLSFQTSFQLEEVQGVEEQGSSTLNCTGKQHEFLYPGKIQEINQGLSFTHEVIHLQHPTVTLIIRTNKPICQQMQIMNNGSFGFNFVRANEIVLLNKQLSLLNLQSSKESVLAENFLKKQPLYILLNLKINPFMWGMNQSENFRSIVHQILENKLQGIHNIKLDSLLTVSEFEDSDDPLAVLTSCVYVHSIQIEDLKAALLKAPASIRTMLIPKLKTMDGDIIYNKILKLIGQDIS